MLDALFIKEFFNLGILEFGPIATSYFLDWKTELSLCSSNKSLHLILHLALIKDKEHLSETGIIINNNKSIFVTPDAKIGNRSKEVHVDQLQWLCCCHDALWWVRYAYLLSGLACTTYPIFLKINIC